MEILDHMKFGGSAKDIEECEAGNWRTDWSSEGRFHNCLTVDFDAAAAEKEGGIVIWSDIWADRSDRHIFLVLRLFTPHCHPQWLHPIE